MSFQNDAAQLNGQVFFNERFGSSHFHTIRSSSNNTFIVNGIKNYSGSVSNFGNGAEMNGTIVVTNADAGTFDLGGTSFQIFGTSPDGNSLIFGVAGASSPSIILVNDGQVPLGTVSYATSNGYNAFTACYAEGTMIATPTGEVAVELLQVGDIVCTASGERPIKWLGRRHIASANHLWAERVNPITIAAGAIGHGCPTRALTLSPDHAIALTCVDEFLVPVMQLVNGSTIVQRERSSVVYWHLELEEHDLIYANGACVETYLDVGNRTQFEGQAVASSLRSVSSSSEGCRNRLSGGPVLHAFRTRLQARAEAMGWLTRPIDHGLHLIVDGDIVPPESTDQVARFLLPRGAKEIVIAAASFVPQYFSAASLDNRRLGVRLRAIRVERANGQLRDVDLTHAQLTGPFHDLESDEHGNFRWTRPLSLLDPELWNDPDIVALQLSIDGNVTHSWFGPTLSEAQRAA